MKFPLLASCIIFVIWLAYEIKKSQRKSNKSEKSFWEKEAQANNTRRKPLDRLHYITIPFDSLPMEVMSEDPVIKECHETLRLLSESPIVNLTGISNTDLKLTYGAPNIDLLTRYDQSYTLLVRSLQRAGEALYHNGYITEAVKFLEFAVSTQTDVKSTYTLLAAAYKELHTPEKIAELIPIAESLNSVLKSSIVNELKANADSFTAHTAI